MRYFYRLAKLFSTEIKSKVCPCPSQDNFVHGDLVNNNYLFIRFERTKTDTSDDRMFNYWRHHFLENPRFLVLLFETEPDTESLGGGGAGASLFSKGFKEVLEDDLFLCLVLGVQTTPLITTPFTISSRLIISLSVEPLSRWSVFPPGEVVMELELELEARGNGADVEDPEISEDDGTFTQRLRRQV